MRSLTHFVASAAHSTGWRPSGLSTFPARKAGHGSNALILDRKLLEFVEDRGYRGDRERLAGCHATMLNPGHERSRRATLLTILHSWDNFFIMAGTAAATLIGLLFVAVTVTGFSTSRIVRGTRGFLTPTLTRFVEVLCLSLAVLAPWPSAWPIGIILSLGGLAGLAYQTKVVVMRHKVGLDLPDRSDWLTYVDVPVLGNGSLIVGAVGLLAGRSFAPYAIAGATVLLLFAGIYGAWDLTLWMIKNREKT